MVKNKAQFRIKRVYNFLANESIYFENIIYSSGAQKEIDLNCVLFLNTNDNSIY